jgi:Arc/MetJ-type ribon-helix-helix transcriptional regulator
MHRADKNGGAPMKTVTISLPESLKGFVERPIATKD